MAAPEQAVDGVLRLQLQFPARDTRIQVSPDFIIGSDIRLVWSGEALRGRAFGRSVFLQADERRVEGAIGTQPMRLTWREEGGMLRLEGALLGSPVGLELSPERITGSVGPCVYTLESRDEAYAGVRVCGSGDPQRVSVWLPSSAAEWGSPIRATALALLLGM